jgi:uncharacterized protein
MRILTFVDTHGSEKHLNKIVEKAHNADIIVCAGDLTIFENELEQILRRLNSTGKPVLVIHGNHETGTSMITAAASLPNIHIIHKSYFLMNDIIFFGFGGGGFGHVDPRFEIWSDTVNKTIEDLEKRHSKELKFVLVTHAPPYGTNLDDLGSHVGSKSIMQFVQECQPEILICGHIHECAGNQQKIKNTIAINPGPDGVMLEL